MNSETPGPLGDDFATAQQTPEPKTESEPERPIVTRAQITKLKKSRAQPQAQLTLDPPGTTAKRFRHEMEQRNQERISSMEERLDRMRHKSRDDFNMTQQHQDMKDRERER
jgi:hypothetical protein